MKKVLACLLVLSLLPFGALSEGWFSSLFGGSGPKLRFVSVGNRAFSSDSARVIAATGDGRNVLISWAYELYLWDTRENRRIPLWFSQPEDVELLNFTADNAALLAGKPGKDQREEKQKQIEQVKQRYLEQHGLEAFTSFDDVYGCYPRLVPLGVKLLDVGSEYALIVPNYFTASLLTDLRTGESRFVRSAHPALCGDRLYTGEEILRLDTGESYAPDYAAVQHEKQDRTHNRADRIRHRQRRHRVHPVRHGFRADLIHRIRQHQQSHRPDKSQHAHSSFKGAKSPILPSTFPTLWYMPE